MRHIHALLLLSCVAVMLCPGIANAQRRYQPKRPTFSPYHDLFRQDNGLLDPYNAQIVPRRRLTQQFNQLQGTIDQQSEEIDSLNQQLQSIESGASPTGKGGTYMNYSHYFGGQSAGGTSRSGAGNRSSGGSRSAGSSRSGRSSGYGR